MQKRFLVLLLALGMSFSLSAQKRKDNSAVVAINYALPKVTFNVEVDAVCKMYVPGPYAGYASKELGVTPKSLTSTQEWEVCGIRLLAESVPDEKNVYTLQSNDNIKSLLFSLTPDGFLTSVGGGSAINNTQEHKAKDLMIPPMKNNVKIALEDRKYYSMVKEVLDSNYTMQEFEGEMKRVWDPIVRYEQMTEAEHVKNLVHKIMEIRADRKMLLSSDEHEEKGANYETLLKAYDEMEKSYMEMFVGVEKTFRVTRTVYATPVAGQKSVLLFNFSPSEGIQAERSSRSISYVLNFDKVVVLNERIEPQPTSGAAVAYRVPARVMMTLLCDGEPISTLSEVVPQLGVVKKLPLSVVTGDGLVVSFHSQYGSIQSITQAERVTVK